MYGLIPRFLTVFLLLLPLLVSGCSTYKALSPHLKNSAFEVGLSLGCARVLANNPAEAKLILKAVGPIIAATDPDEIVTLHEFRHTLYARVAYDLFTPAELAALRPLVEQIMAATDRVIETETSWMTVDSVPFLDLLKAVQTQAAIAAGAGG